MRDPTVQRGYAADIAGNNVAFYSLFLKQFRWDDCYTRCYITDWIELWSCCFKRTLNVTKKTRARNATPKARMQKSSQSGRANILDHFRPIGTKHSIPHHCTPKSIKSPRFPKGRIISINLFFHHCTGVGQIGGRTLKSWLVCKKCVLRQCYWFYDPSLLVVFVTDPIPILRWYLSISIPSVRECAFSRRFVALVLFSSVCRSPANRITESLVPWRSRLIRMQKVNQGRLDGSPD